MIMFIMMMINSSVLVHSNLLIFPRECEGGSRIIHGATDNLYVKGRYIEVKMGKQKTLCTVVVVFR